MKLRIEIRPGEGGLDAKLLTERQAGIYRAYALRHGLRVSAVPDSPG